MYPEMSTSTIYQRELEVAIDAARAAATSIMAFYTRQSASTYTKGDGSPVTDADLAADSTIRSILTQTFPNDALLTEEGANDVSRLDNRRIWIVDPIDGTAQFIAQNGKFDVLIALAVDNQVEVAAAIQPTTNLIHAAIRNQGAWRNDGSGWQSFHVSGRPEPLRLVGSIYYRGGDERDVLESLASELAATFVDTLNVGFQPRAFDPSERTYDVFVGLPQLPGQSAANEWDLAASDLIIREAGGEFTDCFGRHYPYNKRNTHISGGILVSANRAEHQSLVDALTPHVGSTPPALDPDDDLN